MPEDVNLATGYNADALTEDLSDETTEAAPKTYAPAAMPPRSRRRTSAPR